MNQQTNENNSTSCSYQELNPEMDAFLQGYLEEGRRKGLQESTIHLHDKIGHYFLFAMTKAGCLKPQEMNAQNVGIACLKTAADGISRISAHSFGMRINPAIQTGITVVSSLFSKYRNLIRLFTRQRKSKKLKTALIRVLHTESGIMQHCSLQHGWGSGVGTFHP